MINIGSKIARHWPRIIVALVASYRLFSDAAAFTIAYNNQTQARENRPCEYRDLQHSNNGDNNNNNNYYFHNGDYHHHYSSLCLSEDQERIVRGFVFIIAMLTTIFNTIALHASIHKSITATKTSLKVWCSQMGCLALTMLLMDVDQTHKAINYLSRWEVFRFQHSLCINLLFGWALLVMLRDLRGQARNSVGILIEPRLEDEENEEDMEIVIVVASEKLSEKV
ncbi:hypothetical protein BGZ65_000725 [Modicella reniformis]|uniref:Uncharacterized protein n=1 Tax=Modicella reniformis TaxID=1440133 RepID=A0A9P6MA82_9FUNG|nr:hypothetical protein BGZ65_000725 [Modicella reniformis]